MVMISKSLSFWPVFWPVFCQFSFQFLSIFPKNKDIIIQISHRFQCKPLHNTSTSTLSRACTHDGIVFYQNGGVGYFFISYIKLYLYPSDWISGYPVYWERHGRNLLYAHSDTDITDWKQWPATLGQATCSWRHFILYLSHTAKLTQNRFHTNWFLDIQCNVILVYSMLVSSSVTANVWHWVYKISDNLFYALLTHWSTVDRTLFQQSVFSYSKRLHRNWTV